MIWAMVTSSAPPTALATSSRVICMMTSITRSKSRLPNRAGGGIVQTINRRPRLEFREPQFAGAYFFVTL